jgi:glycerate 2-kinase
MRQVHKARSDLLSIYQAGVAAVDGRRAVREWLQVNPMAPDTVSLIAVGKAAAGMTRGALDVLGERVVDGLVVTKYGHVDGEWIGATPLQVIESAHPVPDEKSLAAGQMLLDFLQQLPAGRPLLFLISGGASSLVEVLRPGLGLEDLERVNAWLLSNGWSIDRMNLVRKSLSRIKGGGLLGFIGQCPVTALLLSDVPNDDPAVIGSGLLVADSSLAQKVEELDLPGWLREMVAAGDPVEKAADAAELDVNVIANLRMAREAAAREAEALGYEARVSHAFLSGDAENVGRRLALELQDAWPGVYVWGGEPSVCLPPQPGRGGRNQHLALAAANVIAGRDDIIFLSAGTDGTDGPGEDAGALVDGGTLGRGERDGFKAEACLRSADSGSLLEASGDLINTGPTGTNVMDLIIGLKLGERRDG